MPAVVFVFASCSHNGPEATPAEASKKDAESDANVTHPSATTSRKAAPVDDEALFKDLLDNHYERIFPRRNRNAGGPQFFRYIYENLATSHDLFERYNRFYCGVSGSIIRPSRKVKTDEVRVKDASGQCVSGSYYRCCWPCSCDVMKFARAERVAVTLPRDPSGERKAYTLLTITDPCAKCDSTPCPGFPREVTAYRCEEGRTANGLRVVDGKLSDDPNGRLVFAVLYEDESHSSSEPTVKRCEQRTNADSEALDRMGGMGNIFVDLARLNDETQYSHSVADLCGAR